MNGQTGIRQAVGKIYFWEFLVLAAALASSQDAPGRFFSVSQEKMLRLCLRHFGNSAMTS
jgi:hypothetical protein